MIITEYPIFSQNALNSKRVLLSQLRGGDYAHPGNEEAIDMILSKLGANVTKGPTLDVGGGFGGTLNYLKQKGFQNRSKNWH